MSSTDPRQHLDPLQLAAMVASKVEADSAVQRHIKDCARCRAELSLAQAFVRAPAIEVPDVLEVRMRARLAADLGLAAPEPKSLRSRRFFLPNWQWLTPPTLQWLSAAALLLISLLTWQLLGARSASRQAGVERGGDEQGAWAPTVLVANGNVRIAWTALPQADLYRVRILAVGGRVVWETETAVGSAELTMGAPQQGLVVQVLATGPSDFMQESEQVQLPAPPN